MTIKRLHSADEDVVTAVTESVDEAIQHLTGEIANAITQKPKLVQVVDAVVSAVKEVYPELKWFLIGRNGECKLELHTNAVRMDDVFDLFIDIVAEHHYLTVVPCKLMPELRTVGEGSAN